MKFSNVILLLLAAILTPMKVVCWETAGTGIRYTMEDLVDSSSGAVTTVDSITFVIADFITVAANDTLLIDPGDSLRFQKTPPAIALKISGYLLADGTPTQPIVFTSNESPPYISSWGRIEFEKNPPGSIFDHCHISFAATGISCDSSSLETISNANISSVGSNGISLNNSSPTIRNCSIISFSGSGIVCTENSQPLVGGSLASSNSMYNKIPPTGFTFKNFTGKPINATYNDWGVQDYVYIDSIIVDDDENPIWGEVTFIPIYDITPPQAIGDLAASLIDGDLIFDWTVVTADTTGAMENLSHYVIYRDTVAYFIPQIGDSIGTSLAAGFVDSNSAVGDITSNSFYRVVAVDDAGNRSDVSNGVGEQDFQLSTTTGTDYSWVAFSLGDTGLHWASDLEAHIEAYSDTIIDCFTISEWNSTAQTYTVYTTIPFPMGDFPLRTGNPYRIEVNNGAVWTLVGEVLAADSVQFHLMTTIGTDYTWISLPLHLDGLAMASHLKADIEAYSDTNTTCQTISEWNSTAQTYTTFTTVPFPMGDFPIRPGRAYRVEVDTPANWPSP